MSEKNVTKEECRLCREGFKAGMQASNELSDTKLDGVRDEIKSLRNNIKTGFICLGLIISVVQLAINYLKV